ncbi:MAG: helix-turn-helix domain-containing protein [Rhodoferax sp.]
MSTTAPSAANRSPARRARPASGFAQPSEPPDAGLPATARQLLDVAERLFAERDILSVSLREIVAASGTRNLSAAQYHFGSRDKLVGMLVARRIHAINQLRHARLDALVAQGRDGDAAAIVHATVSVLADAVREQAWGPHHVRIAAQLLMLPSAGRIIQEANPAYWSGHDRSSAMLRRVLPAIPPAVFRDRMRLVNNEAVFSLARWIRAHEAVSAANRRRYDALVRHTIEFLAAGMMAPHAEATARRASSPLKVTHP